MRLKQTGVLLLTSALLMGTVLAAAPAPAYAVTEPANTFTLTVPAEANITAVGWNQIGEIEISDYDLDSSHKVSVKIEGGATGRTLKDTKDDSRTVAYEIKTGTSSSDAAAFGDAVEFKAAGRQSIGAVVADFSSAEAGIYTDKVNFTASVKLEVGVSGCSECSCKKELKVSDIKDLGDASTFTYNDKTYYAYNHFISKTSGTCWHEANAFVAALNTAKFGGYSDWMLLDSSDMSSAWWNAGGSSAVRGGVDFLWSSAVIVWDIAYSWFCFVDGSWYYFVKSLCRPNYGFLVVRGSSNLP